MTPAEKCGQLSREDEKSIGIAILQPLGLVIRGWPDLIRWHTRSLAHRWRAGEKEASSSRLLPLKTCCHHNARVLTVETQKSDPFLHSPKLLDILIRTAVHSKDSRCMDSFCKTWRSTSSKSCPCFVVDNFSRKSYGPGKWKQIQEKMEIKEVIFISRCQLFSHNSHVQDVRQSIAFYMSEQPLALKVS